MKKQILNYLSDYNIKIDEIINSTKTETSILIKAQDEVNEHLKVDVKIEREENKCHVYFKRDNIRGKEFIFNELTEGLIQLINDNSEQKVFQSVIPGWYGWQSEDLSIDFGIKNEIFGFTARFAI